MSPDTLQANVSHEAVSYTFPLILLVAILLWRVPRQERRRIVIAAILFIVCTVGIEVSFALSLAKLEPLAGYLRWIAVFGKGICTIFLCGIATFGVLLPACGLVTSVILQDVLVAISYMVWLFIWLGENNVNLAGIIATSTVITAVIAFSLQDTLGNILGGMAIELERSIQIGDWIRIDDLLGRVVEIRWRHTRLETKDWETVIIPNSMVAKSRFRVVGKKRGEPWQTRRTINFHVDYRFTPARVVDLVEEAISSAEIPKVARTPTPYCFLADYGESYGVYSIRYFLTD